MSQGEGGGGPTPYIEEYNEQAYKLCLLGAIDVEMSDFFGVSEVTLNAWKKKYPKFLKSLSDGKIKADAQVASSLYKKANGYDYEEDKSYITKDGVKVDYTDTKHYPPDTKACEHWLNNRRRQNWKNKQETELTGANGGAIDMKWTVEIVCPDKDQEV